MTKIEKKYQDESKKLNKLTERRNDLWTQGEVAKSELSDYRKKSTTDLISGADGERIAGELAKREAKVGMFAGALAEIDQQITTQQSVADDAERAWSAEQDAATIRQVRTTTIKLIKVMGNLQIDLAKAAKMQQPTGRVIVDFSAAASKLEESQAILEVDAKVRERSKVPSAARIAGWLDDKHSIATLGSRVRDWARQEAS